MIRSIKLALAAGIIAAAVAPSVGAHTALMECNGVVTTYSTPAGTIYTDDKGDDPDLPSIPGVNAEYWIYLETNNHAGLQTGGKHALLAENGDDVGFTDACINNLGVHASMAKDSILF